MQIREDFSCLQFALAHLAKSAECTNSALGYLSTCPLAYSLGFVSPFRSYQRRKLLVALGGRLASDRGYVLRTYRTELLVLKIEDSAVEQLSS